MTTSVADGDDAKATASAGVVNGGSTMDTTLVGYLDSLKKVRRLMRMAREMLLTRHRVVILPERWRCWR